MTGATDRMRDPLLAEAAGWLLRVQGAPQDAAARAELDGWLAQSERHAQAWAMAQRVWLLAGDVGPATALPTPQDADLPSRPQVLVSPPRPRRAVRRPVRMLIGGAVAALAACLAVAILPTLRIELQADYTTTVGESRQVTLADGSVVQLDSDSAIDVHYSAAGREVRLLAGRAFFEVRPDKQWPFSVRADAVAATVTGTAFDVDLAAEEVRVAVQEGAVRVDYPAGDRATGVTLAPGDRLRVGRAGGATLERAAIASIASWRRGRLLIEGATVAEVVAELRRYHTGIILLADETLARRRVTGVFDLRDPVRALRTVVAPHAGRVREITHYLVIVSGG
jgi:transmembrane sensor